MEEIIKKVYNEKLNDGSIEKIISNNIEKMANDICQDLMLWNGPIKKQMKEKIEPLMSDLVEKINFENYTIKLIDIINQTIKQSTLNEYKLVGDALKGLLGHETEKYSYNQKVKISDIFDKYIDFVSNAFNKDDFNSDDFDNDNGKHKAYVNCSYYIKEDSDENKLNYFSDDRKYHVVFTNEKAEEDENFEEKTRIEFNLCKDFKNRLNIEIDSNIRINDLPYMPNFILNLIDLKNNWCNIILDKREIEEEAICEFEYEIY